MTHRLLGIVLLCAAWIPAVSQDFAVTQRGDTLKGNIRIFNTGPDKKIQIQAEGKKKQVLSLLQVKSVTKDNEVYHPVKGPLGYSFMKLVRGGYLSLYGFQHENQTGYDAQLLVKKDGTYLEIPNLNFKKAMTRYLDDCSGVSEKIDNGTFTRKDISAIVDDYNSCMDAKTKAASARIAAAPQPVKVDEKVAEPWRALETAVKERPEFEGKENALEMISEIQRKLSRNEKLPNFLIEGLKSSLSNSGVETELNAALESVKQ